MRKTNDHSLIKNARVLRKNMTKEERRLWYDFLKPLPMTFHRQKVIGNYIVDFYCDRAKLVVELDGSQHYSSEGTAADQRRDEFFSSLGLTVLRYSNLEVNRRFNEVCADILQHIQALVSLPNPQ